jgi:hypothetical protein
MTNKNLFKEAIAEAKAVREAALVNAKAALEEALTPRLQSMLSTKLQEMEYEEEGAMGGYMGEDDDEMEEGFATNQGGFNRIDKVDENDDLEEDFDLSEILAELDEEDEELSEAKKEKEEDDEEEEEEEEGESVADMSVEDLKALIKSVVEQELEAEEEETPADEAGEEEHAGQEMGGAEAGSEDEIDLEELLAELDAMDEDDDADLEEAKSKKKYAWAEPKFKGHRDNGKLGKKSGIKPHGFKKTADDDLSEAISVIKTLRKELNEQNLLNAKLLYVNKIFKAKNLTESQKVRVIASFDKATTPKEAKIVFESLNSSLKATAPKTQIRESLGFASKAAGVAPKKTIVESDAVIARMQKLANIIK